MNAELDDEIVSINAIYEAEVLQSASTTTALLSVPGSSVRLRVHIPSSYPNDSPHIEGPEASGALLKKGEASDFAKHAQDALHRVFRRGEPCMFDLVEELKEAVSQLQNEAGDEPIETNNDKLQEHNSDADPEMASSVKLTGIRAPDWTISEVVTEKKSVFVARAVHVAHPAEAKLNLQHLLTTDKKAAKATHNMTAWRMRDDDTGVVYRDCDDDGESAAGARLLHLLELMNVWNIMVVVSRWYGGVHLGPDRFRIINTAARDAILKIDSTSESSKPESGTKSRKK